MFPSFKGISVAQPLRHVFAFCALIVAFPAAHAAGWSPERNIEIIVPTGPGGGNDRTARIIHAVIQRNNLVSVPVQVLNKPGGGGAIAFTYLNQQAGEGRHAAVIPITILTNHITGKNKFTYTDFTPLAQLYSEYISFAVPANSALKNGRDIVEKLRKDPGSVTFGFASSAGNQNHITIALLAKAAGVNVKQLKTVVFSSGGQSTTAMLGGHVDVVSSGASGQLPHHRAGRARIIAVAAPQRLPEPLADVPTWKELGHDVVFSSWRSMIGPKGMTPEQVAYWDGVMQKLSAAEDWQKDLKKNLWVSNYLNSADSRKFLDAQYAEIRAILTELGLAATRAASR